MSKVVGDVISDNFCLKNSPQKTTQNVEDGQKWKFLPLEQTQPNFVYLICGGYRELTTRNGGGGQKMKILALEPN